MNHYSQTLGRYTDQDENYIGTGWSGQGEGVDNPDMESVHNVGPIPKGLYTIGEAYHHPHLGPITMDLYPYPANNMFDRSAFRIHGAAAGDTLITPGLSSEGCIILPPGPRSVISKSSDRILQVTE